ncbi:MAG TPA: hypothetical protein PKC20_07745 [Burkholderiaceae bacterium]|nr:hypothetical protein [Burkholderiaceae bacterium]
MFQAAEQQVAGERDVEVGAQLAARDAVGERAREEAHVAPVQRVQLRAEVRLAAAALAAARLAPQHRRHPRVVGRDLQVPGDQEAQSVAGVVERREARLDVGDQRVVDVRQHRLEQLALAAEVRVDRALDAVRPRRDLGDRGLGEPLGDEHLAGRGEDLGAADRLASSGQCRHRRREGLGAVAESASV